jgi:hypothetical protein
MHDPEASELQGWTRRRFLGVTGSAGAAAAFGLWAMPGARAAVAEIPTNGPWPIAEPYHPLNGGTYRGPQVPAADDPLVRYRWSDPQATDPLQVYQLRPAAVVADPPASFGPTDSVTTPQCNVEVRGTGSLRFDFGVESPAWLEFASPDFSGAVEMSISEYNDLARVNPGPEHPVKTFTPVQYGNTFRLELNAELFEGVRFGWIHVTSFDAPWHITAVRAVCQAKPTNYEGSFDCSDPTLTRIWYTGAYVVRAGFQADYMAPILMDRGDRFGWAGDCNPIQAAALVAFGDWGYIKANLDRTVDATFGIETYSLYWVLSLLEYYRHTGDTATLQGYIANVQGKLDHANSIYADPDILFYGWDERLGAGFEAANRPETKSAYRMLFIRCCREFADACDSVGRDSDGAPYGQLADEKITELRSDPSWYQSFGVHALAEAVNADAAADDELPAIYAQGFADRLNRLSFSTFNQYFILQAMALMDRYDEAVVTVHDNWGGQIEYGGTTYFEVFRPDWLQFLGRNDPIPNSQSGWTSLAHPWGGGVTAWLTREVLGIRPTSPGFVTFDVLPHLGTGLSWVAGSVPTPRGTVSARFDVDLGQAMVTVPSGSTARVAVPDGGRTIRHVSVDGDMVWDGGYRSCPAVGGAEPQPGGILLTGVRPGRHAISTSYAGSRPAAFRPAGFDYPMRFERSDEQTRGDWGGVYGHDGYVLFNYDGAGTHREALPPYITSVDPWESGYEGWSNCMNAIWVMGTSDRRALAGDQTNSLPRNATCLYSGTPQPSGMTMVVEVPAQRGTPFQLAMYFVDWDQTGRRVAVEVFDLDTRDLVAPEQMVDAFTGGTYLVFECDRPLRLRIAQIRGDNAVLSGLFFDPLSAA